MTPESVGPLSRPVAVAEVPPEGLDVAIEATAEECAALARDFKLPAIHALAGTFHLSGSPRRIEVVGRINAAITQVCVVTLEPFEATVEEEVSVDFATPEAAAREAAAKEAGKSEPPDPIVGGQVDLGALAAEFLALGLDPYPRKPGVDFRFEPGEDKPSSPFAALGKLKRDR